MDTEIAQSLPFYELPLETVEPQKPLNAAKESGDLTEAILFRNAVWFCRIRWIPVGILIGFWAIGFILRKPIPFGFIQSGLWPLIIGITLAIANIISLVHLRMISGQKLRDAANLNLWMQIVMDLLILTVVVHFVGSLETTVPFLYLIHITLACEFFSRRRSFAVLVLACVLYFSCLGLECLRWIPHASIYVDPVMYEKMHETPGMVAIEILSTAAIWMVVWYLASNLGGIIRQRDLELAETNRRLVEAREQKAALMLRTTHELKAPFAAIHANIQLLLNGSCGAFTQEAKEILGRMSARCHKLANLIQEMLQLSNLEKSIEEPVRVAVDLSEIMRWTLVQMEPMAKLRQVTVTAELQPARIIAAEDHLKMLLGNVLSNAIAYSHQGGSVDVQCRTESTGASSIIIEDKGIGIPADKLPKIFDEYYRSSDAARFNPESTGLGLAIVRHIAQAYGILVRVESASGSGTRFTLGFPPVRNGQRNLLRGD
jgi:two-component system, OmpR family, phosphate regulon sensor histidine kinase PhoR